MIGEPEADLSAANRRPPIRIAAGKVAQLAPIKGIEFAVRCMVHNQRIAILVDYLAVAEPLLEVLAVLQRELRSIFADFTRLESELLQIDRPALTLHRFNPMIAQYLIGFGVAQDFRDLHCAGNVPGQCLRIGVGAIHIIAVRRQFGQASQRVLELTVLGVAVGHSLFLIIPVRRNLTLRPDEVSRKKILHTGFRVHAQKLICHGQLAQVPTGSVGQHAAAALSPLAARLDLLTTQCVDQLVTVLVLELNI